LKSGRIDNASCVVADMRMPGMLGLERHDHLQKAGRSIPTRRLSITRELIDQLPPHSHFRQCLDPSLDDGLAIADGLAFQDRRFTVALQYTFQIDCRKSSEELWSAMHFKTRQHIRRAEEKYVVRGVDDPQYLIKFLPEKHPSDGNSQSI
jgi:CheY-like chemotaxis protein